MRLRMLALCLAVPGLSACAAKPVHVGTVMIYDGPKVVQEYDVALLLEQAHQKRTRLLIEDRSRLDTASAPYLFSLSSEPEPNTEQIETSVVMRSVADTDLVEVAYGVDRGIVEGEGRISAVQQGRGVAYLLPGDAAELRIPGSQTAQMRVTYRGVEMRRVMP